MKELIEALEYANNVRTLEYDREKAVWIIKYKRKGYNPDTVTSEDLIEFLYNE